MEMIVTQSFTIRNVQYKPWRNMAPLYHFEAKVNRRFEQQIINVNSQSVQGKYIVIII